MMRTRMVLKLLAMLCLVQAAPAQTLTLPPRPGNAFSRDEIIRILTPLSRDAREDSLFQWIMAGNVPAFLRTLVPVTSSAIIGGTSRSVTYLVSPDYVSVGPEDRPFLVPMTPLLAQRLADALHCTLPTRKMVNDIYQAAVLKLAPLPIPPSAALITVPVFAQHDSIVWLQRAAQLTPYPAGTLVGGTKKDVVISNRIRNELKVGVPKPVVIYGWHQLNGSPIQPLYNGHGETYADYSHGIRLVQDGIILDGKPTTISSILNDNSLAAILSDEGAIAPPRYGAAPAEVRTGSASTPQGSLIFDSFPNPFNTSTEIRYRLGSADMVTMRVYDLLGREAAVLVDSAEDPGDHEVTFDGSGLASGVYIVRLSTGGVVLSGKIVLMR